MYYEEITDEILAHDTFKDDVYYQIEDEDNDGTTKQGHCEDDNIENESSESDYDYDFIFDVTDSNFTQEEPVTSFGVFLYIDEVIGFERYHNQQNSVIGLKSEYENGCSHGCLNSVIGLAQSLIWLRKNIAAIYSSFCDFINGLYRRYESDKLV